MWPQYAILDRENVHRNGVQRVYEAVVEGDTNPKIVRFTKRILGIRAEFEKLPQIDRIDVPLLEMYGKLKETSPQMSDAEILKIAMFSAAIPRCLELAKEQNANYVSLDDFVRSTPSVAVVDSQTSHGGFEVFYYRRAGMIYRPSNKRVILQSRRETQRRTLYAVS